MIANHTDEKDRFTMKALHDALTVYFKISRPILCGIACNPVDEQELRKYASKDRSTSLFNTAVPFIIDNRLNQGRFEPHYDRASWDARCAEQRIHDNTPPAHEQP